MMLALAGIAAVELHDPAHAAALLRDALRAGPGLPVVRRLLGRAANHAARCGAWDAVAPVLAELPDPDDVVLANIAHAAALVPDVLGCQAAAARIADPAAQAELLDRACGALAARAGWDAAVPLLGLLPAPSAACRARCARAALRAGAVAEAAALLALRDSAPDFVEAQEATCVRAAAAALPDAAADVLDAMPEPRFEVVEAVAEAYAAAGRFDAARAVIGRHAHGGSPDAALLTACLARQAGDLPRGRAMLDDALARWPENVVLLWRALRWSEEADDPPGAARYGVRLLPLLGRTDPAPLLDMARCVDEGGDETTAREAADRARVAILVGVEEGSNVARLMAPALRLYDLPAARAAASRLPAGEKLLPRMMESLESDLSADPALAAFVARAASAYAGGPVEPRAADLAIIARQALFPSIAIDRVAGTVQPEVENGVVRRVLARVLARAEAAGLRCVVLPAYSTRLPESARHAAPLFVAYHTTAEPGLGLHVKMSALPDAVMIDRAGYSGWAEAATLPLSALPLAAVDLTEAEAWIAAERSRLAAANFSKYGQAARAPVDIGGADAVLVALQKPDDAVLRHAWVDMFALAEGVARAHAGTGTRVLVKRHPKCRDPRTNALLRRLAEFPHVEVTTASIHDLLPAVRAVHVVNSGLGAEALLYGKAVHIAGRVDYRHACHEIHGPEDILTGDAAFAPRLDPATHARYIYWYRNLNCVPLDRPGALDAAIDARIIEPALRLRG
jgi:hypothetical protein